MPRLRLGLTLACHPELESQITTVPPLGLGYLATWVRRQVPGVEVIIARKPQQLIDARPDMAGISYSTHDLDAAAQIAHRVKTELGIPVLAGGPHITTLPENLDVCCDIGVLGEGEQTLAELCQLWLETGGLEPTALKTIKGLCFRTPDGEIEITPPRPPIADMDSIPFPDRQTIMPLWPDALAKHGAVMQLTSRGCWYRCAFCSTARHWGRGVRYPSIDYVLREMREIRRDWSPGEIHFCDDLFNFSRERVRELSRAIIAEDLHEGLLFSGTLRPNLLDEATLEALAAMNFRRMFIGFESGSDAVLAKLHKSACTREQNQRVADLARQFGIRCIACFILGTPGETREDIAASFEFATQNLDIFEKLQFVALQVLPGTEVFEWARQAGLWDADRYQPDLQFHPGHPWDLLKNTMVYLNAGQVPEDEFRTYQQIGLSIERAVEQRTRQLEAQSAAAWAPDQIAARVPLARIIAAKARRRLRQALS